MENRKDKRFGERDIVLIKDIGKALQTAASGGINAYTHDISVTGARICTQLDFPVGCVIRIIIDLKNTPQPLIVDGKVIWAEKSKDGDHFVTGVKFLHSAPDTILLLIRNLYGKQVGIPSSVS